ncbi:MAG: oligosaccharide flippase family protein [Flavobacteriaceae bacterium]|nr:oligosaccharide flippase family protein [Flavobacteriaceae bacterium]
MSNKNNSFLKDFSWYFLASFVPLLIGFIKTPVFTRHFNKEEYGYLGLVSLTFAYLGMLLFSWIGSCLWRYYTKYKTEKALKTLYSNLLFLYGLSFSILLIVSVFWYMAAENTLVKQLIFYSFFQLLFNQLFLFYMVIVRLKGEAKFYTIFQSIRAFLSILIALFLVFKFDVNISALISSLVIIDALAVLFLIIINPAEVTFNYKLIKRENLKELITYGSAGLIINIGFLVITSSDRYFIYLLNNLETVGIYDQVYKISQISVVVLVTIFFNSINPTLLKELETNFNNSIHLIQKYIKVFIIYGLPIITYLSLFSKDIANILLGKEFRVGYIIMPFIFFAAYLQGLSNFYELRLKFSNQLKRLSIIVISAAILNIILNYIFIELYGYKWAAVTTVVTYFLLILAFHSFDVKVLKFTRSDYNTVYQIILFLVLQIVIYFTLDKIFELNIIVKLTIGLLFILSYILTFKERLLKTEIPINI